MLCSCCVQLLSGTVAQVRLRQTRRQVLPALQRSAARCQASVPPCTACHVVSIDPKQCSASRQRRLLTTEPHCSGPGDGVWHRPVAHLVLHIRLPAGRQRRFCAPRRRQRAGHVVRARRPCMPPTQPCVASMEQSTHQTPCFSTGNTHQLMLSDNSGLLLLKAFGTRFCIRESTHVTQRASCTAAGTSSTTRTRWPKSLKPGRCIFKRNGHSALLARSGRFVVRPSYFEFGHPAGALFVFIQLFIHCF